MVGWPVVVQQRATGNSPMWGARQMTVATAVIADSRAESVEAEGREEITQRMLCQLAEADDELG